MRSFARFAAAAFAAVALTGPVLADPVEQARPDAVAARPTAVVVRIEGGFHPENRWLWYELDGTARFEGMLPGQRGRFRSRVDFAKVERLIADAGLCTRQAPAVRRAGMDMFTYRVSVRCGDGWRLFTTYDAFEPAGDAHVRDAVRALQHLASTLAWSPSNEDVAPPQARDTVRRADAPTP
ncbi:MAG: hypothetical protein QOJ39_1345 [Candidatus Eremiobacteraeota bacterium]|jgi:hypothetical protein|nr:hypothetical protein [Candidatus Eremiobacteraeota bacterium]